LGGPSASSEQTQSQLTQQQIATSQQANAESAQTYATTAPGLSTAENYYQSLASGNPSAIFQSIAPAVGQVNAASQGAVQQIQQNMPRGGAEQLAVANVEQQRAGQIGNLGTQAYTGSFPALAALSQGGLSLSANELANSISAGSAASSANEGLMQAQSAGKTATMGALGGVAQGAGAAGGGALEGAGK
jgi:hypothetical protein